MLPDFAAALSQPVHEVRMLHDRRLPLRDGVELSADVYLPLADGPWPTIVQWTPYESVRERFIAWGAWFAARGYAAVVIDVRGRYRSGGEFVAWTGDGEDAYDSIDWVVQQPWSNGDVGTWGAAMAQSCNGSSRGCATLLSAVWRRRLSATTIMAIATI